MKSLGVIYKRSIYVFSLIIVLIITLTVSLSYTYSTVSLSDELEYANIALLKQVEQNIYMQLSGMDRDIMNFMLETNVRKFMDNSFESVYESKMGLYQLSQRINTMKMNNSNIYSVYLYSLSSQKILSGSWYGLVNDFKQIDNSWVEGYENLNTDYFMWQGTKTIKGIENEGQVDVNVMSLIRSYPALSNKNSRKGILVVNLDENVVYGILNKAKPESLEEIFIVDASGMIISNGDKKKIGESIRKQQYYKKVMSDDQGRISVEINGVKSSVFFITSKYSGWKYISIAQHSKAYNPLITLRNILVFIAGFMLFIALFVVFLVNRWMYKPVDSLINNLVQKTVKYKSNDKNIFTPESLKELENVFGEMFSENDKMQKQINESRLALKWKLMMDILMGGKKDFTDIKEKLNLLNIKLHPSNFVVIIAEIDDMDVLIKKLSKEELAVYYTIICKKAEDLMNEECCGMAVELNSNRIGILTSFETGDSNGNMITVYTLADLLKSFCENYLNITMTMGIGSSYENMIDLSKSYSDAEEALKYKVLMGKNSVISIEDIKPHDEKEFLKLFSMLGDIKNLVRDAKKQEVTQILLQIFDKVKTGRYPAMIIRQLTIQLVLQGANALSEAGVNEEELLRHDQGNLYEVVNQFETMDEIRTFVIDLFEKFCNEINSKKKKWENSELVSNVLQYIHSNYMKNDMCLNHISQIFHFSVPYLSKTFKESVGMNFIDYLIKIRMERAKEMLADGDFKVNEISNQIGYANSHGFIHIFKKYTGMTPGEFKNRSIANNVLENIENSDEFHE